MWPEILTINFNSSLLFWSASLPGGSSLRMELKSRNPNDQNQRTKWKVSWLWFGKHILGKCCVFCLSPLSGDQHECDDNDLCGDTSRQLVWQLWQLVWQLPQWPVRWHELTPEPGVWDSVNIRTLLYTHFKRYPLRKSRFLKIYLKYNQILTFFIL